MLRASVTFYGLPIPYNISWASLILSGVVIFLMISFGTSLMTSFSIIFSVILSTKVGTSLVMYLSTYSILGISIYLTFSCT